MEHRREQAVMRIEGRTGAPGQGEVAMRTNVTNLLQELYHR